MLLYSPSKSMVLDDYIKDDPTELLVSPQIGKHLPEYLSVDQTIRSGELIGYNAEVQDGEVRLFEFELWNNGKPVDPEGYIVF